jgi:hypothetical protein
MAQKIQIRRGVEAQRALVTPDAGELLFTTDQKQLFVGDGATAGGWLVGGGSAAVVVKHAGTAAIAAGADSVTVTGLALPSVPAQVLVTVRKHTGGANLFATVGATRSRRAASRLISPARQTRRPTRSIIC